MEKLGPPPEKPLKSGILIEDMTIEALGKFIVEEQPAIGISSDEAGRFIGGQSMNSENLLKTMAILSQLWDGKEMRSTRVSTGTTQIAGKRASMHHMMQGIVAAKVLSNEMAKSQGFLSRVLICEPESKIGERVYRKPSPEAIETIKEYSEKMKQILRHELPFKEGLGNELDPRPIPLSENAKKAFIKFYNEVEIAQKENGEYENIRGFASKAPEHAARIAVVIALYDDFDTTEISIQYMVIGIALVRYYLAEAKRQIGSDSGDDDLKDAQDLLDWMQARGRHHAIIDVYQSGPMAIRSARRAKEVMYTLEEHGWVECLGRMEIKGKMRREVWKLT